MLHLPATGQTLMLAQGDLAIVPHGSAHVIHCPKTVPPEAMELDDVLQQSGFRGEGVLVWGGDGGKREIELICGHFTLSEGSRHLLFDNLPPVIHLRGYGEGAGPWLEATLKVIGAEAGGARLGGDLIALKMSEAIFAQAIRAHIEQSGATGGSLAGFADPNIARALTAFHRVPAGDWTVEKLAREAGLSRTSFAERFTARIGITPMAYVTSWRMQIAREALATRRLSVAATAEISGYASESAFSRAFKNEIGLSPAAFRATSAQHESV